MTPPEPGPPGVIPPDVGPPEPGPSDPHVLVVRGQPDDEELAALVVVLAGVTGSRPARPVPGPGRVSTWRRAVPDPRWS